jgi:hypothetical protein
MTSCYYRLSETKDPEERLEDAALAKALHDVLGPDLTILAPDQDLPEHGLHLGRSRGRFSLSNNGLSPANIPYWEDPAFLRHTTREWGLYDLEEAEAQVDALHKSGRDAVVKSTLSAKHMVTGVRRGTGLAEALDAMVYSFIDRGPCLLVQEAVPMRYERRFLIMNREVVTQSAVGSHLTPMSRFREPAPGQDFEDLHLLTPGSRTLSHLPGLTARMTEVAREIAETSGFEHVCVDLCLIGEDPERGVIEPIEYNPMQPGMVGLFGCDPYRIAAGVARHLELNPQIGADTAREAPEETPSGGEPELEDETWFDFDA